VVTFRNLREGVYGGAATHVGKALMPWVIPITVGSYLVVAVIAQLVLDVIHRL
jgi:hypothetical protein